MAPALQAGLTALAKPWFRRRALRVFRDKTSLSASPELWPAIESALSESRYFILLASSEAAASHWVDQEVRWWREKRTYDTVLIALTEGELRWDAERGDFQPSAPIPDGLRGWFPREPLWVDLRWARGEQDVSMRNPRFRDNVGELAAPVHGLPKDELIGEDITQHRHTLRLVRAAVGLLLLLLAVAIVGGVIALVQRNRARDERNLAVSRLFAARAQADLDRSLDRAALTSLEAMRLANTDEARASAQLVLQRSEPQRATLTVPGGGLNALAFSADSASLAVAGSELSLVDVATGRRIAAPPSDGDIFEVAFAGDELAWIDAAGGLTFWNQVTGQRREASRFLGLRHIAIAGGVLADARGEEIQVGDARDMDAVVPLDRPRGEVRALALSDDGRLLAVARGSSVELFDTTTGHRVGPPLRGHQQWVTAVAFNRDGSMLASGSFDRGIRLWRIEEDGGSPVGLLEGHPSTVRALAFSPDGKVLVSGGGGSPGAQLGGLTGGVMRLWDVSAKRARGTMLRSASELIDVEFSPDGRNLATAAFNGQVALWYPSLWATDGAALERRLCQVAGRNLTEAEWQTLSTGREYTRTCENLPAGNPIAAVPERFAGAYDAVSLHQEPIDVVLRGVNDPTCRRLLGHAASCFTMHPTFWNITDEDDFAETYGEVSYRNGQLLLHYENVGLSVPSNCEEELDSYRPAKDGAWVLLARLALGDAEFDCTLDRLEPGASSPLASRAAQPGSLSSD